MKKPTKAKAKKTASNKKKKTAKKAAAAPKGCCTLTGSGPDEQREGLTREECRLLAISKGKNPHWVEGKCAEPD
jgi:hypothetical protein